MAKGNGNGQGNFTPRGRKTGPMRKFMLQQMQEEKRRKKYLRLQNFLAYRAQKILGRV